MKPTVKETACCALVQLQARNATTVKQLTTAVNAAKRSGRHAVFVITTPDEGALVATLRSLDFAPVAEFKRSNGNRGMLTMWVKRW